MGYMCHHAIIVIAWQKKAAQTAQRKARAEFEGVGASVTSIAESHTNGYWSFMVAPDGSKEGWNTSKLGDEARERFIEWLNICEGNFQWAEVAFPEEGPYHVSQSNGE